ncbi:hypothetical protein EMCRGX_G023166 [Ephydatia muelleri]
MYGTNRTEPGTTAGFAQKLKESLQEAYKLSPVTWYGSIHQQFLADDPERKGPLKVAERLGENNYKVISLQGRNKTQIVHFDRLNPCVTSTAEDPQNSRPSAKPEVQIDCQPTGKNAELLKTSGRITSSRSCPPPPQEINIQ